MSHKLTLHLAERGVVPSGGSEDVILDTALVPCLQPLLSRGPDGQKAQLKRNSLQKMDFATGDCGGSELLTITEPSPI